MSVTIYIFQCPSKFRTVAMLQSLSYGTLLPNFMIISQPVVSIDLCKILLSDISRRYYKHDKVIQHSDICTTTNCVMNWIVNIIYMHESFVLISGFHFDKFT
jgi:hypothetical protein